MNLDSEKCEIKPNCKPDCPYLNKIILSIKKKTIPGHGVLWSICNPLIVLYKLSTFSLIKHNIWTNWLIMISVAVT